ncbi:hypothetical protein CH352_05280 [Leptospira hartskeerlii]|uniref:SMP-30/gluconolaconase/LRE-like region n=1 Tax=Leptospira hartskeerlii TaxID=2023177 RepID=A0A2M9XG00_9LEPT|nr:hypothetical protein [Leptospira hartskeerlii]PJZ26512.1 hypothetical protein CH357_03175 [Leptospira hartskeerlii]PJZ35005.1 hypothetical protein CH352_05280 [Leptospira hartskeerlii]
MNRKRSLYLLILFLLLALISSQLSYPEEYFKDQIQESVNFTYNSQIEQAKDSKDLSQRGIQMLIPNVPAQDEIILQEELGRAFVSSMDGFIWILDLKQNKAEPFVKTPLMPAGMVAHPKNSDLLYFCVSRGKKEDPIQPNGPGIYELKISNKSIRKISNRVPKIPPGQSVNTISTLGKLYATERQLAIRISEMNDSNSRQIEKADDLAISSDGERIYFTEPYDHPGAILGVSDQSRNEALSLGKNGNVWKIDLKNGTSSLVAHNYSYVDGILLEYSVGHKEEVSILLNEVSRFRLIRMYLSGENSGKDEIVIDGLPGFPDGMDRDPQGRVWVALVIERSKLVTWLHNHPFWKRLVLYIPQKIQPVSKRTGLLVLSKDGKTPLYYGMHDGSKFSTLIVVIPGKEKIYLSVYEKGYKGINILPYPI